jgi:hypothetical protein
MKKSIFSAFLLACTVTHSAVAAETYEIDPVHSFVLFKVIRLGAEYVMVVLPGAFLGWYHLIPRLRTNRRLQ